jgi:hypothetical protein
LKSCTYNQVCSCAAVALCFAHHFYFLVCYVYQLHVIRCQSNVRRAATVMYHCYYYYMLSHSGRVLLLRVVPLLDVVVTGVAGTVTTTVVGSVGLPVMTVVVLVPEPRTEPIGS